MERKQGRQAETREEKKGEDEIRNKGKRREGKRQLREDNDGKQ